MGLHVPVFNQGAIIRAVVLVLIPVFSRIVLAFPGLGPAEIDLVGIF